MPVLAPRTGPIFVAQPVLQAKPRLTYAEMVSLLEPLIAPQAEAIRALVGNNPGDVTIVYAVDITGREVQVCLACGRVGHDVQPSMMRQENVEIDMLTESLVIFQESCTRAGVRFAVLAADDTGTLVLRTPFAANGVTDRSKNAMRFQEFKDRHAQVSIDGQLKNGRIDDQAWLARESANWHPSDAHRKTVGATNDEQVMRIAKQIHLASPTKVRGIMYAKSQMPAMSLRGTEVGLKSAGIVPVGLAIGKDAQAIKAQLFSKTHIAADMHDARERQLGVIRSLLENAK